PTLFSPITQIPDAMWQVLRRFVSMKFVVRTNTQPLALSNPVRQAMAGVDVTLPVTKLRSMEQIIEESVAAERFNMTLLGLFAGLGLLLAALGIYGVLSYSVAQRTHEIGIRMALGAQRRDVLRFVVGQGMFLALTGVVIGLISAFALTRLMASLLFGVRATDPLVFIGVAILLTIIALLACYIPARRATKIDPIEALRYE
ncbi:MAG: FtsX-like permease family protein, partial [Pyrinomonadaceae bacterium]